MNGVSAQPRFLPKRGGLVVVAGSLRLSEITVKIHRGHMTKVRVRSLTELVKAVQALELRRAERSTA